MNIGAAFGVIALVTSIIGLLPQSYKAFKTQSTHDVSMTMVINYLLCSLAWVGYGISIHSMFVFLSNFICAISSIILILQKKHYDRFHSIQLSS
jgi:MtN3 and saliva related transmembrane protein